MCVGRRESARQIAPSTPMNHSLTTSGDFTTNFCGIGLGVWVVLTLTEIVT